MARAGFPWAPTSLPQIRRQWYGVLGDGVDRLREHASGQELAARAEEDLAGLTFLPTDESGGFQPDHVAGALWWGWSSNSSRVPAGSCFSVQDS